MRDHFTRLAHMYENAPCNERIAPTIKITEAAAVVEFDVTEELCHSAGALHGAYYFKAMDDAAFFAVNSLVEDVFVLTVSFTVQLFRPVTKGRVRCRGSVVRRGKRMIFAESVLEDGDGNEVARGNGVFTPSKVELTSVETYQ